MRVWRRPCYNNSITLLYRMGKMSSADERTMTAKGKGLLCSWGLLYSHRINVTRTMASDACCRRTRGGGGLHGFFLVRIRVKRNATLWIVLNDIYLNVYEIDDTKCANIQKQYSLKNKNKKIYIVRISITVLY